jgi:hypothetical protein
MFLLKFSHKKDDQAYGEKIDDRKREEGDGILDDGIICIAQSKYRRKGDAIYLSTEQCGKKPEKTRSKKSKDGDFEVLHLLIFRNFSSLYKENKKKPEYTTKKRKEILWWDEKQLQKLEKMPCNEVFEDKLLIDPVIEYMEQSREK